MSNDMFRNSRTVLLLVVVVVTLTMCIMNVEGEKGVGEVDQVEEQLVTVNLLMVCQE